LNIAKPFGARVCWGRRSGVTAAYARKVTAVVSHGCASSVSMRCIFPLSEVTLRFFGRRCVGSRVTGGLSPRGRPAPGTDVPCPLDNGTARFTVNRQECRPNRASLHRTNHHGLRNQRSKCTSQRRSRSACRGRAIRRKLGRAAAGIDRFPLFGPRTRAAPCFQGNGADPRRQRSRVLHCRPTRRHRRPARPPSSPACRPAIPPAPLDRRHSFAIPGSQARCVMASSSSRSRRASPRLRGFVFGGLY